MEISLQLINRLQKLKKLTFPIEIHSISRAILSDENKLLDSAYNKVFGLFNDHVYRKRSLFSSNLWNNAERTLIITALSDLEIFKSKVKICISSRILWSQNLPKKGKKDQDDFSNSPIPQFPDP